MATPANPAADEGLLYFKTDGKLYKKIGSVETVVEGGSVDPRLGPYSQDISGTNLDNVLGNGWSRGNNLTNSPDGSTSWFFIETEIHDGFGQWQHQRASGYGGSQGPVGTWERIRNNGVWGAWRKMSETGAGGGIPGTVPGMFTSFSGGQAVNNGISGSLYTASLTSPSGAKIAVITVSGGFKSAGNAAATVSVKANSVERKQLRLHNNADAAKTPSGTVTAFVSLAGLPASLPISVDINVDASGSPVSLTVFNVSVDYITGDTAAVDTSIMRRGTWSGSAGTGTTDRTITFDQPYPTGVVPHVVASFGSANLDWVYGPAVIATTNTGFTLRIRNAFSSAIVTEIKYIAMPT
jgi:hypothetical protein